ncbi:MAG: nickel-dependent lactate racemase [Spirochaetales bacterium]|nr:nickel-dependent lactate racemase [Spirochaetales bacterium]MCF7938897.1 nickel-dependent lactate racemase [Spirochaetales bacterium]
MYRHHFPYEEIPGIDIPRSVLQGVYSLKEEAPSTADAQSENRRIVREALENPIGSDRLRQSASSVSGQVLVVVDDITRSTKTEIMLPAVLAELEAAGVPDERIGVYIALGTHRRMTGEEIARKYTPAAARRYRIINPDWQDASSYLEIGTTAAGDPIRLHREVHQADFIVGVGQTIPHMIAGFGGGGKIIVPGCADEETIGAVHWASADVPEDGLYAVRDNPVRALVDEMAERAGLRFLVNQVPSGSPGGIGEVFAGEPVETHRRAAAAAARAVRVPLERRAEIVVADAYPADLDFWQALKGLNAAYGAVRDGGTVILVTPCEEGVSPQHGIILECGYRPEEEVRRLVEAGEVDRVVGAHLVLARRLLERAGTILVTSGISREDVADLGRHFAGGSGAGGKGEQATGPQRKQLPTGGSACGVGRGISWAPSPQAALEKALEEHGPGSQVAVLYKAANMLCRPAGD